MRPDLVEVVQVLFFPEVIVPDKAKAAVDLNELASGVFDGDPLILPIPDDAPPEVPRFMLLSKDSSYEFQMAKDRLSLKVATPPNSEKPIEPADAFRLGGVLVPHLYEAFHVKPHRAGLVATWAVSPKNGTPTGYLLENYVRTGVPLGSPVQAQLHSLEKLNVGQFQTNLWTRILSGTRNRAGGPVDVLLYVFDVNTFGEVRYSFSPESIDGFLLSGFRLVEERVAAHLGE